MHTRRHRCTHALGDIAEINLEGYGLDLLKAGTNLSDKSAEVLLDLDAKSFPMNGKTVRVAQVNTVDLAEVLDRQAELEALWPQKMQPIIMTCLS